MTLRLILQAVRLLVILLLFSPIVSLPLQFAGAQSLNGFDVSNATIDVEKILSGGPPRDGIPSIDNPLFVSPAEAGFLRDDDIVVGVVRGETARAYPLRILVWHEIANDVIEGEPIAVTYCPLCGTAMVFDRTIDGASRSFGVSGLLFQSDVLMYDRETESLWSQLAMKSISGPSVGTPLEWLPSEHLTWKAWREKYPLGVVLSTDTGFRRNYAADAYDAYFKSSQTMFPVPRYRKEMPEKSWVLGVIVDGKAKAYAVDDLPENGSFADRVGDVSVTVQYDRSTRHPEVTMADGTVVSSVMVYWFAWQAFYPDTELWES